MDNLTHTLCGWALSRAGLDRFGAWVPPVVMLAANLPDLDIVIPPYGDKASYLAHHRGLSHSLLGIVVGSLVLAAIIWFVGRQLKQRIHHPPAFLPALLVVFIGTLSHLFLDWLNTYGIRPLQPFNDQPLYGDMALVVDPWMWIMLGGAIFVGSRKSRLLRNLFLFLTATTTAIVIQAARLGIVPPGVLIAWVIGLGICVYLRVRVFPSQPASSPARLGLLAWTAYLAILFVASRMSVSEAYQSLKESGAQPNAAYRLSANPVPAIPWRYEVIAYSDQAAEQISVNLFYNSVERHKRIDPRLNHPGLEQIKDTPEYQAWHEFARFPVVTERGGSLLLGDLRFRLTDRGDWSEISVPLTSNSFLPR